MLKISHRSGAPRQAGRQAPGLHFASGTSHAPGAYLCRRTEGQRTYFRCDRFFSVGGEWFVTVREGRDIGPFDSHEEAELALAGFVAGACLRSPGLTAALFECGDRDPTCLELLVREFVSCWQERQTRSANSLYVWVQQRLDSLEQQPDEEDGCTAIRACALLHLLREIDGERS